MVNIFLVFIVKMSIITCKMQIGFIQKYQKQRYNNLTFAGKVG